MVIWISPETWIPVLRIVADSVPQKEYQECINKAKAVMNALATAQGGIDQ